MTNEQNIKEGSTEPESLRATPYRASVLVEWAFYIVIAAMVLTIGAVFCIKFWRWAL